MERSYNGWTASPDPSDFGGISPLTVVGESFAPGVRNGGTHTVLGYVAEQMHLRVEPVYAPGWHEADDWGYSYRKNRNANNLSCHASATAIDYNATRHPNGKRGTFSPAQVREIHQILGEADNCARWGGDFSGTADEMHIEICKTVDEVERTAARLRGQSLRVSGARSLQRGSVGGDVKSLQRVLNAWYPWANLIVDGVFGQATERVVEHLQTRAGLVVDGVVGPATKALLGID